MTKQPKTPCLRGKKHRPDEWKLAQVIIDQKLMVVNMSLGVKCALNDLKKYEQTNKIQSRRKRIN